MDTDKCGKCENIITREYELKRGICNSCFVPVAWRCVICDETAVYNFSNQSAGKFCGKHALDGMIIIRNNSYRICKTCLTCKAEYGMFGERIPTHCLICKHEDMFPIKPPKKYERSFITRTLCNCCRVGIAEFNYRYGVEEYCMRCRQSGMINVFVRKCQKCRKNNAAFSNADLLDKRPTRCDSCKEPGDMQVRLIRNKCVVCNKKRAVYNYIEYNFQERCCHCKEPGMVSIRRNIYQERNQVKVKVRKNINKLHIKKYESSRLISESKINYNVIPDEVRIRFEEYQKEKMTIPEITLDGENCGENVENLDQTTLVESDYIPQLDNEIIPENPLYDFPQIGQLVPYDPDIDLFSFV